MTTLLLLRHGRTRANEERRIQGQDDPPLAPGGLADAAQMAQKLIPLLPGADIPVFCSPLLRARDTLAHIRACLPMRGEVIYDGRLMEIDFGRLTGSPVDAVLPLIQHHKAHTHIAYPGGESGDALRGRVLEFLGEITRQHAGGMVLVVTHFGVIETALHHYFTPPQSEVRPAHGTVHRVDLPPSAPPLLSLL